MKYCYYFSVIDEELRLRKILQDLSLGHTAHKWQSWGLITGSLAPEPEPVITSFLVKCIRQLSIQGIHSKKNRHINKQLQLNVSANYREEGSRKDVTEVTLKTNREEVVRTCCMTRSG